MPYNRRFLIVVFCALASACHCAAQSNPDPFTLVEKGKARSAIVIPDEPLPVVRAAAEELQYHVKQASGVKLPIVVEGKAPSLPNRILLGATREGKALPLPAELSPNACLLRRTGNTYYVIGDDSPGQVFGIMGNNRTRVGTLFGVYELLEKDLGIRWLWPGELGEHIPAADTAGLVGRDEIIQPALLHNRWRDHSPVMRRPSGWQDPAAQQQFLADQGRWLRRNRFALGQNMDITHAFHNWFETYGQDHPEWFNLLPDGTRRSDPLYWGGPPNLISMCVSNEQFIEELVGQAVERHRRNARPNEILTIDASENDTPGKCTCPDCMAMDVPDPNLPFPWDQRLERARQAFLQKDPDWYKKLGSLSDRYARFLLAVQARAEKTDPRAVVKDHVYANHFLPPLDTRLNERVMLAVVAPGGFPWTQEKKTSFRNTWGGWREHGCELLLRPNYAWHLYCLPLNMVDDFKQQFDFAWKHGLCGTDFDSLHGQYAAQGPFMYAVVRLQTRPEMTADELLDEYAAAFGPAATAVREYFDYLKTVEDRVAKDPKAFEEVRKQKQELLGQRSFTHMYAVQWYTPEVFARAQALLDKATAAAGDDTRARQRVEFLRKGLTNAQLSLAVQRGYETWKRTGQMKPFAQALGKLDAYRKTIEPDNAANMAFLHYWENFNWNRNLIRLMPEPGRLLPTTWAFQFDPDNQGIEQGWMNPDHATEGWTEIPVGTCWEKTAPGEKWKTEHGKDYNGFAWYRTSFPVPAENSQHVRLVFGAVDEACRVWVNGKLLVDRPYPFRGDTGSWQQAFAVDISDVVRRGQKNTLAVRVQDDGGVGGITRPVWLLCSPEPFPVQAQSRNLIPNGDFSSGQAAWQVHIGAGTIEASLDSPAGSQPGQAALLHAKAKAPQPVPEARIQQRIWGRWYLPKIAVSCGQNYTLTLRVRTSADFDGKATVWLVNKGPNTRQTQAASTACTNGQWKQLTVGPFQARSSTLSLYLNVIEGTGKVWYDDIRLLPSE